MKFGRWNTSLSVLAAWILLLSYLVVGVMLLILIKLF